MFLKTVSTLAWLRWRMFVHRAFRGMGLANLVSTILIGFSLLMLALAIGACVAIGFIAAVHTHNIALLGTMYTLAFGFMFGMIVFLPLLQIGSQEEFDARRCLIFPVPLRHLYAILILSELGGVNYGFAYPTLAAVLMAGILFPGKAVLAGSGVLLLFAVLTAVWSNLILMWLQGLMQKRRLREVVIIGMTFLLICVATLPQVVAQQAQRFKDTVILKNAVEYAKAAAGGLPPVMASRAMMALQTGRGANALAPSAGLLLFLLMGVGGGLTVFRRVVLDAASVGSSKSRKTSIPPPKKTTKDSAGLLTAVLGRYVPVEIEAVWAKDLRYIYRSTVGKLGVLMVPIFCILFVTVFSSKKPFSLWGYGPGELLFIFMSIYISMCSSSLCNNLFAWEGQGIKSYFMMPAPGHRVLLGKNLALWIHECILFGIFVATYSVIRGMPRLGVFATALLCFSVALVLFSTAGNFLSIFFPKKSEITSYKRSTPSNAAAFVSLLVLAATTALLVPAVLLPAYFDVKILTPPILLVLLCCAGAGYAWSLQRAARLLENRKEDLLRILRSTD